MKSNDRKRTGHLVINCRLHRLGVKCFTMVEVSKHLFDEKCRDVSCQLLLHPWHSSCLMSTLPAYKHSFLGSAKFYLIVHLVQNVLRGRKVLKKKELIQMGEYYMRSTILGGLISGSCVTFGCLFRWLLGKKMNYYTYMFLPNVINGVCILLEPPSRRGLIINLFSNLTIEFMLRSWERSGHLSLTTTKKTLMFMVGSAVLFYLMRLEGDKATRTPLLWLFTPEKVKRKTDNSNTICPHEDDCWKYMLKGTATYFGIGAAVSLAQVILPKITSPLKALSSIRGSHLKLALFFGSYIGIYRSVICYLCRKRKVDSALYALPAGYLAGLSFIFKPSLGFAIASLTGAFKLYSTILYEKKMLPENIPLTVILYCLCQGTLFHARFMHPDVCPSYVFKLMKSVSNGTSEQIYSNFLEILKSQT
ncbi:Transmembrane protein 135 [Papilio machaon]|uniref:Transmembrane protein 135 n=1 Tax=Papilio machaon TaxID=76193 RepID=A0A0N1IFT7_PAPMA|nr:Transmembrane protein 135 [Papilio machaon]